MDTLPTPPQEAIIYEDDKLYVCLASFPLTQGHTVVVWKEWVKDLHSLPRADYEYLMDTVDVARNMLMEKLGVEKVYVLYLDEANHVHWHLVPRFNEQGFTMLAHDPKETHDFGMVEDLRNIFIIKRNIYGQIA